MEKKWWTSTHMKPLSSVGILSLVESLSYQVCGPVTLPMFIGILIHKFITFLYIIIKTIQTFRWQGRWTDKRLHKADMCKICSMQWSKTI